MKVVASKALGLTLSLGLTVPVVSCGIADGLTDVGSTLGSPDAALIDAPGRRIGEGRFRNLTVDGTFDEGGHVVALQDSEDGSQVVVLPYPEGSSCTVAPAVSFERITSRISVELPGVFAVQADEDKNGRGTIKLVNFDCEEVYPNIVDARLPKTLFPSSEPEGVLSINGEGSLLMINPALDALREIDSGISLARTSREYIFARKDGKLVVFDQQLKKLDTFGTGVGDFVVGQGSRTSLAFYEGTQLSVWSEEDGVTHLSDAACEATFWGNDVLAYYEPCEERRLRVHVLRSQLTEDSSSDDFVTLIGPDQVASLDERATMWGVNGDTTELLVLLSKDPSRKGKLVRASLPSKLEEDASEIELEVEQLSEENQVAAFLNSEVLLNFDGAVGDLVEFERDEDGAPQSSVVLAEKVVRFLGGSIYSPQGILSNYDGVVGDLVQLERAQEGEVDSTTLLSDVPTQSSTTEPETGRWTVLGDSKDGATGTLYLSESSRGPLNAIAEDVWVNTARFLEEPRGVSYLAGEEDGYAQLQVYLIESGLTITIHNKVNEYRVLPWPSPGILYAVPEGEDQGLWYAKAR